MWCIEHKEENEKKNGQRVRKRNIEKEVHFHVRKENSVNETV